MAALHSSTLPSSNSIKLLHFKNPRSFSYSKKLLISKKTPFCPKKITGVLDSRLICKACNTSISSSSSNGSADEIEGSVSGSERRRFDINLAVILAGFAFEAYTTPSEKIGKREMDAANCQTVFLSESFVREIYDGQVFIKLKKGVNLPAMDPWGTSDPYVIIQLDSQVVKSKVKWGTKEPTWNEEFALNIKQPPMHSLQVAAWDANLVTPHKRMGNSAVDLENLCDGNTHEVLLDLEGMGGGGKIQLEIKYKSFEKIDDEKKWWKIPVVTEFLQKNGFEPALKKIVGSETVQAREFVQFAFGQLKSLNDSYVQNEWFSNTKSFSDNIVEMVNPKEMVNDEEASTTQTNQIEEGFNQVEPTTDNNVVSEDSWSDKHFWKNLADSVNQNLAQKLGFPAPEKIKWDGFDLLNSIGLQSREIAEASYVESGLASPSNQERTDDDAKTESVPNNTIQKSLPDIKKVTQDLLRQTDSILGAVMVINAAVSKFSKEADFMGNIDLKEDASSEGKGKVSENLENNKLLTGQPNGLALDEKKAEEMRELFSTAESAMEAWAMLANACGHPTFIKSEFEKICFLDNASTDTQVAIWRDSVRNRLVIAFRGTEQTRWKDLITDLMLVPAGLNPERIDGDFKQEIQVHSGFLGAYDSVRPRLISLIKQAIGYRGDSLELLPKWHIYVTGHSLGGALSTLLALELSSSQLAKHGAISVTMYNFGSPRVGNRRFAEIYNEKVKDSWRVVNHRDIIPTVPRLMGYCHVAHPIYLAAGDLTNAVENKDFDVLEDGYQGDVIGEATPDVLVSEFMKGEKELVEKILNTEINIFLAIRDGSALMQHMEDFYYVSLLEHVRSNYRTSGRAQSATDKKLSV